MRDNLAARVRLSGAMMGRMVGDPVTMPIQLGELSFSPNEFESLVGQALARIRITTMLADAGYDSEKYGGAIGVFAGKARNNYFTLNLIPNRDRIPAINDLVTELGNEMDYMPTRISYLLNLTGPSVNIQTACSTSLVAIYHACQSLINHHC